MESNGNIPEHFHANTTSSSLPDALFASEREARAYLATRYADSASRFINDESCEGDLSLVWEAFEMARAILTGDGTETENGREWQDDDDYAWFDRCDKAECGSWTWQPAHLALAS